MCQAGVFHYFWGQILWCYTITFLLKFSPITKLILEVLLPIVLRNFKDKKLSFNQEYVSTCLYLTPFLLLLTTAEISLYICIVPFYFDTYK